MKKIIALLLVFVIALSVCACEKKALTPEEAFAELYDYVVANGQYADGSYALILDSGVADTTFSIWASNSELYLKLDYEPGTLNTAQMETRYTSALYFYGAPEQKDGTYFGLQWNSVKAAGTELAMYCYMDIAPAAYTPNSPIVFSQTIRSDGQTGVENDEMKRGAYDGLHTALEIFAEFIGEELGLDLADFGFNEYFIMKDRESQIRSEIYAK